MPRIDVTLVGVPAFPINAQISAATAARQARAPEPGVSTSVRVSPASAARAATVPAVSTYSNGARAAMTAGAVEPDATNTGPYTPTSFLTAYSGPSIITSAGTRIENKIVPNWLQIRASGFVLHNCIVIGDTSTLATGTGLVNTDNASATGVVLEDSKLIPQKPDRFANGVIGKNVTAKRLWVLDVTDPFYIRNTQVNTGALNSSIQMCYVESVAWHLDAGQGDGQTHNDGIQLAGGDGSTSDATGNTIRMVYSTTVGDTPRPDRGTGTAADGRYNWGSLVGIQFTNLSGFTTNFTIFKNWFYGAKVPISAGTANNTNIGTIYQNLFDDTQGQRSSNSAGQGHTISMDATTTCLTGDGTANANKYMPGIPTIGGTEVTVRRNA